MSLRRTGNVTINQASPAMETVFAEDPTSWPDPAHDGGRWKRYAGNPIISYPAGTDRVIATCVLEDAARNRLIALGYVMVTGGVRGHGRKCCIWSAPWGHPEGPFTLLNDTGGGNWLINAGTAGAFDDACTWHPNGVIDGNWLYMAYTADRDDGVNDHNTSALNTQRIGLAKLNLATTTTYVATKLGQAELGTTPYEGHAPQLSKQDGCFHLWVQQWRDSVYHAQGSLARLFDSRLYRSAIFGTAAANWVVDPHMKSRGTGTVGSDLMMNIHPLGNNRWLMSDYSFSTFGIEADCYRVASLGAIWGTSGPVGAWDENITEAHALLYHQGKWYYYYSGNNQGVNIWPGTKTGMAEYAYDQQDFSPTPTQTVLPYRLESSAAVSAYNNVGTDVASGYVNLNPGTLPAQGKFEELTFFTLEADNSGGYLNTLVHNTTYLTGGVRIKSRYPTVAHTHADTPHNHGAVTYADTAVDLAIANNAVAVGTEVPATTNLGTLYYAVEGKPI